MCVCAKGSFPQAVSENPLAAAGTGLNFSDLPSAGDDSGLSGRLPRWAISELISLPPAAPLYLCKQFPKKNSSTFYLIIQE